MQRLPAGSAPQHFDMDQGGHGTARGNIRRDMRVRAYGPNTILVALCELGAVCRCHLPELCLEWVETRRSAIIMPAGKPLNHRLA